jgi:hypothetical protein
MLRPPFASSLTALAPLVALIICGGCSSATETEPCLAINSSLALVVKVTDARSDAYIASGATLKWRQGTRQGTGTLYVTSQTPDASPFLVGGAPGTYDILVEKQGYAPYSQSVVVPGNRCGPLAVELTAKLVPLQ